MNAAPSPAFVSRRALDVALDLERRARACPARGLGTVRFEQLRSSYIHKTYAAQPARPARTAKPPPPCPGKTGKKRARARSKRRRALARRRVWWAAAAVRGRRRLRAGVRAARARARRRVGARRGVALGRRDRGLLARHRRARRGRFGHRPRPPASARVRRAAPPPNGCQATPARADTRASRACQALRRAAKLCRAAALRRHRQQRPVPERPRPVLRAACRSRVSSLMAVRTGRSRRRVSSFFGGRNPSFRIKED